MHVAVLVRLLCGYIRAIALVAAQTACTCVAWCRRAHAWCHRAITSGFCLEIHSQSYGPQSPKTNTLSVCLGMLSFDWLGVIGPKNNVTRTALLAAAPFSLLS